jgi:hypothetical protein
MAKLPDREGLTIFAKVSECRSFADAPVEQALESRTRLGARLIVRTARRFELTDA